jgi:hypothetical protein
MRRSVASSPAALSPAARQLLELGSVVEPPTAEQDERMDRALARLIALNRAGASTRLGGSRQRGALLERAPGTPTGRLPLLSGSAMTRLLLALGALAATAGASFWVGRASVPEEPERPSATAAEAPLQVASEASPAVATSVQQPPRLDEATNAGGGQLARSTSVPIEAAALRAPRSIPPRAVPPRAGPARALAPQTAPLGLNTEIQRLARAEAALRRGRAQRALVELEPPATHLREQAAALRAIAECTLDREPAAARARETLLLWPTSAFAPRIREACGL